MPDHPVIATLIYSVFVTESLGNHTIPPVAPTLPRDGALCLYQVSSILPLGW